MICNDAVTLFMHEGFFCLFFVFFFFLGATALKRDLFDTEEVWIYLKKIGILEPLGVVTRMIPSFFYLQRYSLSLKKQRLFMMQSYRLLQTIQILTLYYKQSEFRICYYRQQHVLYRIKRISPKLMLVFEKEHHECIVKLLVSRILS